MTIRLSNQIGTTSLFWIRKKYTLIQYCSVWQHFDTPTAYVEIMEEPSADIHNLLHFFNSIYKICGFVVINVETFTFWWYMNNVYTCVHLILALICSCRAQLWALDFLQVFHITKLIFLGFTEIVVLSPICNLIINRIMNFRILSTVFSIYELERRFRNHIRLNVNAIKVCCFFGISLYYFNVLVTTHYTLAVFSPLMVSIDAVCITYFEFYTAAPALQFACSILFLTYITKRIRYLIVNSDEFTRANVHEKNNWISGIREMRGNGFTVYKLIRIKQLLKILTQVGCIQFYRGAYNTTERNLWFDSFIVPMKKLKIHSKKNKLMLKNIPILLIELKIYFISEIVYQRSSI